MSDNLMDLIKGAVSKQVMGQMGGILGQSPEKTSSAFETAAGSILGGMMKKSNDKQGLNDIFDLVKKDDGSVLDKLGGILGGGQQEIDNFQKSGGGILDSVLGTNRSGMLGTLAKFLGFKESMMGTLMSMAAPIVMGVIGRYVKNKALDAVGLGKLFGAQKQHLGGFMPSSLTSQLGFGNLLGNVTGAAGDAVGAVGDAGRAAVGAAGDAVGAAGDAGRAAVGAAGDAGRAAAGAAGDAAAGVGNLFKILLPLIALGVLGWLAYTFLIKGNDVPKPDLKGGAAQVGEYMEGVDFGGFDMNGLKGQFDGITEGFSGLNADNAQGLADKITGLTGSLDGMDFEGLPGPAKTAVGTAISGFKGSVETATAGIQNESWFSSILQPVIKLLMDKFSGLGF